MKNDELQIQIDDVYACPGSCAGCMLNVFERKSSVPEMSSQTMQNIFDKLKEYSKTLIDVEKINITFGIADHFLMPNEYLEKTYLLASGFINHFKRENKDNSGYIYYTTSLIGKYENTIEKINFLKKLEDENGVKVGLIIVLDPKYLLHKTFAEKYVKNILEAKKIIQKIDLSMNLSEESMTNITPKELYNFTKNNQFDELTIVWTPNLSNLDKTFTNMDFFMNWLLELDALLEKDPSIGTSFRLTMLRIVKSMQGLKQNPLNENIKNLLDEIVYKDFHFDSAGNLSFKFEAVGDVPNNERFGFKNININENGSIKDMVDKNKNKLFIDIVKQYKNKECLNCDYIQYCANSGFFIYNKVINDAILKNIEKEKIIKEKNEKKCFHMGKILFEHYENQIKDGK